MTNREFFISRWELEHPKFLKVLRALPADRLSYRPHERSTSAAELAWLLAEEQRVLCDLLRNGDIAWETRPAPASLDEIVEAYERHAAELRELLRTVDDAKWTSGGSMKFGDQAYPGTVDDWFWGFLFDAVHHRGQLSTYIRPMGGKVPAIYGPSADDAGM